MKKRNLTPEQRAKTEERKAARRALAARVGKMTPEERAALAARCPVTTIEGRVLSVHNQCLVALQNPGATIVGGFRQWINAGRSVRKGEHGIAIWVPIVRGEKKDDANAEPNAEGERTGFILGTIFDTAQTEELTSENKGNGNPYLGGGNGSFLNQEPPDGWKPEDKVQPAAKVPAYATDNFEAFAS